MIITMLIMLNLCTNVRMVTELNTKRRSFTGGNLYDSLQPPNECYFQHYVEDNVCVTLFFFLIPKLMNQWFLSLNVFFFSSQLSLVLEFAGY